MALTRLQQLCIAGEAVEGTAVSAANLFAASAAKYLAIDPSMTFEVETYTRNIARESFTPLSPLAGAVLGSATFSLEMNAKSGATIAKPPQWELPLLACGFRRESLIRITIPTSGAGSITNGPILHGQTLTMGGTATVIGNYYTGSNYIWCTKGTDNTLGNSTVMTAGAITITGSTATATGSAVATNAALGYWPTSTPFYTITCGALGGAINPGDVIVGNVSKAIGIAYYSAASAGTKIWIRRVSGAFTASDTASVVYRDGSALGFTVSVSSFTASVDTAGNFIASPSVSIGLAKDGVRESLQGARGTVSLSGTIGEPMLLNFTFNGVKTAAIDGGGVSSVTYDDATPPVLLGVNATVGDSTSTTVALQKSFCANSFSLDFANDVQYRRCMSASTGIDGIYINGRTPAGTFDPEQFAELDFAYMSNFFSAAAMRMDFNVGTTAPNLFRMKLNNMAITSVGQSDRNGVIVRDIGFALHSGSGTSLTGDNEFAIIWDLTV